MASPGSVRQSQRRFAYSVMTPIMLYLMLFSLIPLIWAIILGFFDYSPARVGGTLFGLGDSNPFIGIRNYLDLFSDSQPATVFRKSVVNTFLFTSPSPSPSQLSSNAVMRGSKVFSGQSTSYPP